MKHVIVAIGLLVGFAVPSIAADEVDAPALLEVLQGRVLLDSGHGAKPALAKQMVMAQDKVILFGAASAVISSAESGCVMSLRKAGVYAVPQINHCVAGQAQVLDSDISIVPTNGVYVAAPPPPPGFIAPVLVVGGFASAAVAATVYAQVTQAAQAPISAP